MSETTTPPGVLVVTSPVRKDIDPFQTSLPCAAFAPINQDKFSKYDSSLEGSSSPATCQDFASEDNISNDDDQTYEYYFTDSVEDEVGDESVSLAPTSEQTEWSEQKLLAVVRQCMLPLSDKLDPFAALPVTLNKSQEHLVSFYLMCYPQTTYGFSPNLQPHPVAVNFSIAMTTPACFQVALARSAMYQLSLGKYTSDAHKNELDMALQRHKHRAVRIVQSLSQKRVAGQQLEALIASIISLGTLDRRGGLDKNANLHFQAVRRMLRSIGGPTNIRSPLLSRVMAHFECIYGSTQHSYVWEQSDLRQTVEKINNFFSRIRIVWGQLSQIHDVRCQAAKASNKFAAVQPKRVHTFGPRDNSLLLEALSRFPPPSPTPPSAVAKFDLISQLASLLMLCSIILDNRVDQAALQTLIDTFHTTVEQAKLQGQPANNIMWLLQISDQSEQHSRRVWACASYVWILKFVSWNVQCAVKEWLLKFLTGKPVDKVLKLDGFHFSYAS